jgi:transposase
VVVDHDTGRLVWAAPGRDEATVGRFFDDLGEERAARRSTDRLDGRRMLKALCMLLFRL